MMNTVWDVEMPFVSEDVAREAAQIIDRAIKDWTRRDIEATIRAFAFAGVPEPSPGQVLGHLIEQTKMEEDYRYRPDDLGLVAEIMEAR